MKLNRLIYILFLTFGIVHFSNAQSKEKIKGNRNVTIKQTYIDDFNALIIKNNFDVKIAYNSKASVEIETDDNLHDVIDVNVSAGILSITTNKRITSKKKLIITVNYSNALEEVELYDNAELRSLTSMELNDFKLKTENNSRAYLNVKSNSFSFTSSNKSKSRLNVVADSTSFIMSDNSKLDALVSGKISSFDLYQSADASIEGDAETATLRFDNSANFTGKNYTIKNADLLIESNSDATLNIITSLKLNASGNSETYIYGEPKIDLELFTDTARLQKKKL
ncbi:GIN domain-containing protein [Winogradskyella haliclonae]|uniref:Putative auto-transporter adhesin head GIN domain-containing protein n=1 Tax=Winogradskyella haliclonae TaxID=2048558 RepID=A0ABQ2BZD8_9FLAO|nr:DUF2807 domain-containing protein [Winogradskyella haliclonae]GGI57187.1 hypothetical protein GCM10011444_14960 [Winogradskyella haliclonae]